MANTVSFQISDELKQEIIKFYQDSIEKVNNQYIVFAAKIEGCQISIYSSNKIVFQGKNAEYEASIWTNKDTNKWRYTYNHIGSDEVGTGDFFGPVCVAACYVKTSDIAELDKISIGDSKTITDDKILEMGPKLIQRIPYSSLTLNNVKFNELTSRGYNMNKIKAYLHNQAILTLRKRIDLDEVAIVDQFCEEPLYYSYLKLQEEVAHNLVFTIKGESYSPSIAAASIIARYSFLKKRKNLSDFYHLTIPKGAGSQVDLFAKEFYLKFGKDELSKVTKVNFKNTKKVIELLNVNMFDK
jgi:ribonuclease HIII